MAFFLEAALRPAATQNALLLLTVILAYLRLESIRAHCDTSVIRITVFAPSPVFSGRS